MTDEERIEEIRKIDGRTWTNSRWHDIDFLLAQIDKLRGEVEKDRYPIYIYDGEKMVPACSECLKWKAKLKVAEGVIEAMKKFKLKLEAFKRYQQQHTFQGMEAAEQSWAEVSDSGMLDFSDLFEAMKAYDEATK